MRLFIAPNFKGADLGAHGGIRRVIDAQREYFASSLVDSVDDADTVAIHAGSVPKRVRGDQKVIAHCHGLLWTKYDWNGVDKAVNQAVIDAIHISDFVTAPTEWVANAIRRATGRSVTVVPHAVDPEWQPGNTNKNYVLWNKSRIDKVCDPQPVYQVASMLPGIEFRLTVGRVASPNIRITGLTEYSDHKPVQEAGVYLATAQETFGIGILEALACGIPVVGWDWGGQAEILPNKWLAREGDYDKLAELIQWALKNHDKLREQCIEIASKYTWDAACVQYEEIYNRQLPQKRVSVVIRNYNLEKYLPECIESVLPQLTDQDELIVVDDCSTDNSQQVVDQAYWLQTPKNLHLAGALNYAMEYTSGKYILHIDADNLIAPNTLDTLANSLDADRRIDIAYGGVKWLPPQKTNWPPQQFSAEQQLAHKNQIPCTAMYRRKVFDAVGPYRHRCRVAEDADFWCRAASLGFVPKYVTSSETLIYRIRQGTTSQVEQDWPWHLWYNGQIANPADSCDPVLVSVIIPIGPGHELYLQDALDSLWMQSFRNWECIVINDTGHSIWVPEWVNLLNTSGEVGPSYSRNLGLTAAKAKLWLALDADDYLVGKDALIKMVRTWRINKNKYVYCDFRHEDGVKQSQDRACQVIKTTMPHILTGLYPNLAVARFSEMLGEDWDYVLQLAKLGYCGVRIPEPLTFYRTHAGTRRRDFDSASKQAIIDKWENIELACGCKSNQPVVTQEVAADGSVVLVKYIGTESKRYFIGAVSGRNYAFGASTGLQEKYVLREDLATFISRPDRFVIVGVI